MLRTELTLYRSYAGQDAFDHEKIRVLRYRRFRVLNRQLCSLWLIDFSFFLTFWAA
jgi:hypothetical protein